MRSKFVKNSKLKKIISISLEILLLIVTVLFISLLKILNVVPDKYFICGTIIVLLITLTISLFMYLKSEIVILKVMQVMSYILAITLVFAYSFGIYYLNKTMNFIDNISIMKEEITNYYIVVLSTSKYQESSDLYGSTLAYHDRTDENIINRIKLNLEYTTTNNIVELKDKLFNGEVESILISDIIKNKLEEDYDNFDNNIRILETISIKNQIEDITKKVSIKNTPFNVLISGIDTFGNINLTSRNDVNIIATVNPNTNKILLTSIPRDYYVQLHGTTGYKDKLTHASYYGINTQVQTIEDIFDININYYIKVNFSTVVELVNELGGIEVYADQDVYLRDNCIIKQGYNFINGECALAFSRERHSYVDGDRHRGRNQQEVIKAIFNKMSNASTLISEYTGILNVLNGKFATNMDMNDVLNLIKYEIDDLKYYNIESIQVDGYGSMGETYSYPYQKLWIMIPYQDTIDSAKENINKVLNDN